MNRVAFVSLLLLAAVAASACGGGGNDEQASERYARSFDRIKFGEWQLESSVRQTPRNGPAQVIWEVTRYPDMAPTPEQLEAADDLRERSLAAAQKNGWFDYAKGMADGFERQWNDKNHFYKWDYIKDDAILDPERPEFLMYYPTEEGQVLAGFMFLTSEKMEQGPQPAGPLVVWHYHLASHPHCFREGVILLGHPEGGQCLQGELSLRSPEMVHVWFLEHPEGRFATRMTLTPPMLRQALEEAKGMGCCLPEE